MNKRVLFHSLQDLEGGGANAPVPLGSYVSASVSFVCRERQLKECGGNESMRHENPKPSSH